MKELSYSFSGKNVRYLMDAPLSMLEELVPKGKGIIITDDVVNGFHREKFAFPTIVIPSGEQFKTQATVDSIIQQLIALEADRSSFIIGVGGGVVTDIAGFVASVYMRGIAFGFVPSTLLAQVDASIGGKNGIDAGHYKNLIGVIRQPAFILFDHSLLHTLPAAQWENGFAEIIKHACIKDAGLFEMLERKDLQDFQDEPSLLAALIERNVIIKSDVVEQDEFEQGDRRLLNFGHTYGHAIENVYSLLHGHAISIGMAVACAISVEENGLDPAEKNRVLQLLQRYNLPVSYAIDNEAVFNILKMDKKRVSSEMNFILLNRIGEAIIKRIPLARLEDIIQRATHSNQPVNL